jgi:hypothetical protein
MILKNLESHAKNHNNTRTINMADNLIQSFKNLPSFQIEDNEDRPARKEYLEELNKLPTALEECFKGTSAYNNNFPQQCNRAKNEIQKVIDLRNQILWTNCKSHEEASLVSPLGFEDSKQVTKNKETTIDIKQYPEEILQLLPSNNSSSKKISNAFAKANEDQMLIRGIYKECFTYFNSRAKKNPNGDHCYTIKQTLNRNKELTLERTKNITDMTNKINSLLSKNGPEIDKALKTNILNIVNQSLENNYALSMKYNKHQVSKEQLIAAGFSKSDALVKKSPTQSSSITT